MSLMGQRQHSGAFRYLSVKQPQADSTPARQHVVEVPKATERIAANSALFDHFVSQQLHRHRYVYAERLGGLHVDDQLEFGRRLHGKLAGLGTL